jgi:hypothetical protein
MAAALLLFWAGAAPAGEPASGAEIAELAAFVAGAPLDETARRRLADIAAEEARRDPAASARARRALSDLLPKIRRLGDEVQRAAVRRSLATELYWASRREPDPAADLILGLSPVVGADPKSRLIVRQADLDGFCRSANIAAEAASTAFDREDCMREVAATARRLPELDFGDRALMVAGEKRAAALAAYWGSLDARGREAAITVARKRAGSSDPLRLARPLETIAVAARMDATLARFGDAAAEGLASGAAASAIGNAARGF